MLTQEIIEDLKKDCTFEEIQHIQQWLKDMEEGNVYTHEEVRDFIDNELFGKYKIHA